MINKPEKAAFPSVAFKLAAWFWNQNAYVIKSNSTSSKGDLNELADGTFSNHFLCHYFIKKNIFLFLYLVVNFALLTHSLANNDIDKLKERVTFNDLVLNELNYPPLKRGQGIKCNIGADPGYAVPMCLSDFKKPYCGCEGTFEDSPCLYGYSGNNCRSPPIIKCCVEKCSNAMDLVS